MAENATIARRWFREVWGDGGDSTVDQLLAQDATGVMEGRVVSSPADFKDARRQLLEVFPDLTLTVEDIVEQDNKVVVRWNANATHRGDGLGVPATNRRVSFRGMTWLEMRGGQVVRGWDSWNLGGLILSLASPGGGDQGPRP